MIGLQGARAAEVLLAEDNEDDVVLTREGFEASRFAVNLHHVVNGELCLKFLRKQAPYEDVPTPDLVLLDLNMPVMNGLEVLEEICRDPGLASVPIVVLTTSERADDISEAYRLRVSSYITKPVDFNKFLEVIQELGKYWLTVVVLPNGEAVA